MTKKLSIPKIRLKNAELMLLNLSNRAIYHSRAIQSLVVPNSERLRHIKIAIGALNKIADQIKKAKS